MGLLLSLGAMMLLACATVVQPRSANPYVAEEQRQTQATEPPPGVNLTVPVGVIAAGGRRAEGACFTPCVKGTTCNAATGMCDALPCRGECTENQRCDQSTVVAKCVDDGRRFTIKADAPGKGGSGDGGGSSPPF